MKHAIVVGRCGRRDDRSSLGRPAELLAATDLFPAEEFPKLREALGWPKNYWGAGFKFGIQALARGLLAR